MPAGNKRPHTVKLYKNNAGEWQVQVKAGNGEIIFPPEGYVNKADAWDNFTDIFCQKWDFVDEHGVPIDERPSG